ncbi:ubiquitin hydrolase L3 [Metarhizium album ARSEF 1941]|uniref:Ubiquitin carboxyl-terminal hydrolase n=1 Tax=Metarhizium album (strain ARSEF 1941) TaxID=1081103 RepID=A0A0B2WWJ3_METAS|nr:ubiquitin hydrolase L3 [Metarhizium album ARSEF 1941]KHN97772.1 ubiquitin hydrolase L3 [Metarhizium album ARSEF 1941]
MSTEGVWISPTGRKSFIPLENNPEVFTSLVHDLGVSPALGFYDVYSLDEPSLLSHIPRPVYALIFIAPSEMQTAVRRQDGLPKSVANGGLTYDQSGPDEPVVWFLQTIGNACGLYALVHSVANGDARQFVSKDSVLARLIETAVPLRPHERAKGFYDNQQLEEAHMRAARLGSSRAPPADVHAGHHFISFVKGTDGHLWELEGTADGPIDRGPLADGDDMLSEGALEQGVKRFIKMGEGNVNFSIVALAKNDRHASGH